MATHVPTSRLIADRVQTAPKDQDPVSRCHRLSPLVRLRQQTKTADEPHTPWRRPFRPLASVSRALDLGSAARAHASAAPGPRRSKAHVSSAHATKARASAVRDRLFARHAFDTVRSPWPGLPVMFQRVFARASHRETSDRAMSYGVGSTAKTLMFPIESCHAPPCISGSLEHHRHTQAQWDVAWLCASFPVRPTALILHFGSDRITRFPVNSFRRIAWFFQPRTE
jgi:hypothetical protein